MKRLALLSAFVLTAALTIGTLSAGDNAGKGKDAEVYFRKLDANKDGRLSRDEFLQIAEKFRDKDKARRQLALTYDKLDPKHQGLTCEQFRTFVELRARKRQEEATRPEK